MKAFTVTDVKSFMNGLLQGDLFSSWELRQAELGLACRITLQGAANRDYFPEREAEYLQWPEIQPKIKGLIQGGHTPSFMHLTLAYPREQFPEGNQDWIDAFLLNLSYEKKVLTLITGVAANTFSMNRDPERLWDAFIPKYFSERSIMLSEDEG